MEEFHQEVSKAESKLRNAQTNELHFWDSWKGTAQGALASLTDDIYMYEAENHKYGKGYGIKYSDSNFWFSPGFGSQKGTLVNAVNESITSEEMESIGTTGQVMNEQIQRLIDIGLGKVKSK